MSTHRVLIFSLAYYPRFVSGAEAAIREITDRIDDIEFDLLTLRFDPSDPVEEKIGNVHVHRVGRDGGYLSKALFPFTAAMAGKRLHRAKTFDAVWAMMTYMLLPTAILRLLGARIPFVLTLQDGDPYEKVFGRMRIIPFLPMIDWGMRNATVIQAISSYLGTWPGRRGSRSPIEIIRNGANPKDLKETYDREAVEEVKRRFDKKPTDVWLVNTARLVHQKGNDDTIRALKLLPDHVKLLLVGGGEDEGMLKSLVSELHLENRVYFTGQVDRSQVTSYRKAADIFVGPSRSEGLGNAFLSAMASRLPVVATQEGGLADFLFDEKKNPEHATTGWAVEKDDPKSIATAVEDVLSDREKANRVTEVARKMVVDTYDWDNIAKEMRTKIFEKAW